MRKLQLCGRAVHAIEEAVAHLGHAAKCGEGDDGSFAGYEVRLELRETIRFTFDPAKEERLRRMMNRPIAETRLLPGVLAEWMKDNYITEATLGQILSGI